MPDISRPTDVPKVTPADVASLLGCSPNHARHLMRAGQIESWKLGHRFRTTWAAVQAYLAKRKIAEAEPS